MGEVYRARDTRLDRIVAIKVLNSALSSTPDLKARFEREAKSISQLNHPNICTLYDVGHEDDVDFLVMEFLEGETLADRLLKGALPLGQALKIGVEIAGALEKAHRQGILHRDLKPGNIMLTKTGAKLMDFGLAKPATAFAMAASAGPLTPSTPTMTVAALTSPASPLTQKGQIVGTFHYMAPEVLHGAEAEARSDIFSFGCMLYEAVTGRRAFEGKSQLSVLTAILEKDPEPVSSVQPLTPAALDHVIEACLAKEPDARIASAHDIKLELEWVASQPDRAVAPRGRRLWERTSWAAAVLLCLVAVADFAVRRPTVVVTRSSILSPKGSILDAPSSPGSFAVSPDGTAVVFSAVSDGVDRLYLRRLRDADAQPLPGTEDGRYPFWSPDSASIGFFSNHDMRRIDLGGGPAITLCVASNGRGGAWGADGNIYFVPAATAGLMRIPASGGTPAAVAQVDQPRHDSFRWPVLLPDGKHLVFFAGSHSDSTNEHSEVMWAGTDGSNQHALVKSTSNAAYADGYLLFTRDATLMAQKLDANSGQLTGTPQVIVNGVQLDPSTWRASFAVDTAGGALTYIGGTAVNIDHLMWLDENARPVKEMGGPAGPVSVRSSRTGNRMVIVAGQPESDVWIADVRRNITTRFTFDHDHQTAVWSPDGKYIAYCERGGTAHLYFSIWLKAVSGAELARQLLDAGGDDCPADWSPDGKTLAFQRSRVNVEIWLLPLDGGKPYPLFEHPDPDVLYYNPMFSPDGRWLTYVEAHQGNTIVNVVSFPGRSGKWQVSTTYSGLVPFWSPDGKELYYMGDNKDLMAVAVDGSGPEFKIGATRTVTRLPLHNATNATQPIDIASNGKGFAAVLHEGDASASLTLVQNFTRELKK